MREEDPDKAAEPPPKRGSPTLFDIVDHDALMDLDDVPICPPDDDELSDYPPTSPASSPESGFVDDEEDVEGKLAELIPGGVGRPIHN